MHFQLPSRSEFALSWHLDASEDDFMEYTKANQIERPDSLTLRMWFFRYTRTELMLGDPFKVLHDPRPELVDCRILTARKEYSRIGLYDQSLVRMGIIPANNEIMDNVILHIFSLG
jgi:hypothetical protein